jgi:hypothetical protein
MVKTGYAKGANSGHITQERELKPKPARRKGVRNQIVSTTFMAVVSVRHDFHYLACVRRKCFNIAHLHWIMVSMVFPNKSRRLWSNAHDALLFGLVALFTHQCVFRFLFLIHSIQTTNFSIMVHLTSKYYTHLFTNTETRSTSRVVSFPGT